MLIILKYTCLIIKMVAEKYMRKSLTKLLSLGLIVSSLAIIGLTIFSTGKLLSMIKFYR